MTYCEPIRPAMAAVIALTLFLGQSIPAQSTSKPASESAAAVTRALPLVQKAAANYPKNRSCFSCHHQTLPMLAMVAARAQALPVDEKLLQAQAEFTHKWFQAQVKNMKQGQGIGGRAINVGYGLWCRDRPNPGRVYRIHLLAL